MDQLSWAKPVGAGLSKYAISCSNAGVMKWIPLSSNRCQITVNQPARMVSVVEICWFAVGLEKHDTKEEKALKLFSSHATKVCIRNWKQYIIVSKKKNKINKDFLCIKKTAITVTSVLKLQKFNYLALIQEISSNKGFFDYLCFNTKYEEQLYLFVFCKKEKLNLGKFV